MKSTIVTLIILSIFMLVGCGGAPLEPTARPTLTPFPTLEPQPTRTPFNLVLATSTSVLQNQSAPTPIVFPTFTPIQPIANTGVGQTNNSGTVLVNGRGLTNGAAVTDGQFQVEGYCTILNPSYGVAEDGTNWYCTFNEQNAIQLRQADFNDICQRTYSNTLAVAIPIQSNQPRAYQWRCYQPAILPTPTSSAPPQLLNNGRGLSTGAIVNNGEVEVEGYCASINSTYGVDVDQNFWYCTSNGQRILTLGSAEFDEICIRTYNNPAAYAVQVPNGDRPAFQWRCFAIPN